MWLLNSYASEQGGGDRGIGPPLLGLGLIPPPHFLWCAGNVKYQNLLRITYFLAQNWFFYWGQAPRRPTGRAQPLPRPHPFTLLNIYPALLTWLRRHWLMCWLREQWYLAGCCSWYSWLRCYVNSSKRLPLSITTLVRHTGTGTNTH